MKKYLFITLLFFAFSLLAHFTAAKSFAWHIFSMSPGANAQVQGNLSTSMSIAVTRGNSSVQRIDIYADYRFGSNTGSPCFIGSISGWNSGGWASTTWGPDRCRDKRKFNQWVDIALIPIVNGNGVFDNNHIAYFGFYTVPPSINITSYHTERRDDQDATMWFNKSPDTTHINLIVDGQEYGNPYQVTNQPIYFPANHPRHTVGGHTYGIKPYNCAPDCRAGSPQTVGINITAPQPSLTIWGSNYVDPANPTFDTDTRIGFNVNGDVTHVNLFVDGTSNSDLVNQIQINGAGGYWITWPRNNRHNFGTHTVYLRGYWCSGGNCPYAGGTDSRSIFLAPPPTPTNTPTPTPIPRRGCNDVCTINGHCNQDDPNRICYQGRCRLSTNETSTNCSPAQCLPRYCNAGIVCDACSQECGTGGTQSCRRTTYNPGNLACIEEAFSRACDPAPQCSGGYTCNTTTNTCERLQTVSGMVFQDDNKNRRRDSENGYSGGTSTITFTNRDTGAVTSTNTGNGSYTSGQALTPGRYRVSLTSALPTGYQITEPVNGPPPFFEVIVGPGCSAGGSLNGYCNANGDIADLHFGITNSIPWRQCVGASCRIDTGYNNPVPPTAIAACGGPYAVIAQGSSNTPGVIYSGNSSYSFGGGQSSPNPYNWVVGGGSYPDDFTPVNAGVIRTSYNYYLTSARQSGTTITELTNAHCGAGGLSNCQLSASLPNGIYRASGNLTLTGSTYTFPANRNFVILVNGTLRIETNIRVPNGSTATFSASGDIRIDRNVGEATITSYTPNIEGYYSTDRSFIIEGINNCSTGADRRFNVGGAVVVNAGNTGGTFQNNRDLCGGNVQCPSVALIERVDFILNAPQFIKSPTFIWQEVAP